MEAWLDMRVIRIPRPKLVISAASAVSAVSAVASSVVSSVAVGSSSTGNGSSSVGRNQSEGPANLNLENDHLDLMSNHHHHLYRMNGGVATLVETEADSCSN